MEPPSPTLRERREATVREHMESENRHEFDVTMNTFDHPRYEIVPTGEVHDGPEAVAEYFRTSRSAFPDQRNENAVVHHAEDAVIVEFDLARHASRRASRDCPDRAQLSLPDGGVLHVRARRRSNHLRARVLRPGHDRGAAAR
jgi:ketosteroid isomerase-like protein